ncbi:MAG: hypothetical protein ACRD8Z_14540 [Nitrososphaeraceae archaeon]
MKRGSELKASGKIWKLPEWKGENEPLPKEILEKWVDTEKKRSSIKIGMKKNQIALKGKLTNAYLFEVLTLSHLLEMHRSITVAGLKKTEQRLKEAGGKCIYLVICLL